MRHQQVNSSHHVQFRKSFRSCCKELEIQVYTWSWNFQLLQCRWEVSTCFVNDYLYGLGFLCCVICEQINCLGWFKYVCNNILNIDIISMSTSIKIFRKRRRWFWMFCTIGNMPDEQICWPFQKYLKLWSKQKNDNSSISIFESKTIYKLIVNYELMI